MEVIKTPIEGLLVIKPRIFEDDRGNFFESWSKDSFLKVGLDLDFVQDNQSLSQRIQAVGDHVDEISWPLPLLPAFEKQMTSSKIADVRNQGKGRWGGASQAAGFLKQFVQERETQEGKSQIPWAHLDIAGTAGIWGGETNVLVSHGATGIQVRALHRLITQE